MNANILALDLGTQTGWALRQRDGGVTSGSENFRPQRFEGGGMRFLRFKRWLTELKTHAGGLKVPTHPYRCALGRLQPQVTDLDAIKERGWRDQHILVVNASDERLDFVEREFVRRIGERLYGKGGLHHG